jgi:hypothetical protein
MGLMAQAEFSKDKIDKLMKRDRNLSWAVGEWLKNSSLPKRDSCE